MAAPRRVPLQPVGGEGFLEGFATAGFGEEEERPQAKAEGRFHQFGAEMERIAGGLEKKYGGAENELMATLSDVMEKDKRPGQINLKSKDDDVLFLIEWFTAYGVTEDERKARRLARKLVEVARDKVREMGATPNKRRGTADYEKYLAVIPDAAQEAINQVLANITFYTEEKQKKKEEEEKRKEAPVVEMRGEGKITEAKVREVAPAGKQFTLRYQSTPMERARDIVVHVGNERYNKGRLYVKRGNKRIYLTAI